MSATHRLGKRLAGGLAELAHGLLSQMGVTLRCRRLGVSKRPPDDGKRTAGGDGNTRKGVAQIMDAYIVEASDRADAPPGLLQVDQAGAVLVTDDVSAGAKIPQ